MMDAKVNVHRLSPLWSERSRDDAPSQTLCNEEAEGLDGLMRSLVPAPAALQQPIVSEASSGDKAIIDPTDRSQRDEGLQMDASLCDTVSSCDEKGLRPPLRSRVNEDPVVLMHAPSERVPKKKREAFPSWEASNVCGPDGHPETKQPG